ncbi:MAG: glycosyltransferase [Verrucomicrobiota bacterium]
MKACDIVQFHSDLSGGVKRYLYDKVHYFSAKEGIDHFAVIPVETNYMEEVEGSRVYGIASPRLPGSRSYRMLISRTNILNVIKNEHPDIIEVDSPYRSAWIGVEAAARHGIPVVGFYHSDYPRAVGRTLRRYVGRPIEKALSFSVYRYLLNLYNRMSATVVATQRFYRILEDAGIQRLVRIPLGTDVDVFSPRHPRETLRAELGLPGNVKLLLYVGRIAREKNVRQLLQAMEIVNDGSRLNAHLLLVGDGEQRRLAERYAFGRSDITLQGYCKERNRLAELFSAADLLVHPGTNETFGLVCLEAQACGTRALAVRNGGLEEALAGDTDPVLADDASPDSLARAIRKCLDSGESEEDRHERRERIVNSCRIELTFERLLKMYNCLCRNSACASGISEEVLSGKC